MRVGIPKMRVDSTGVPKAMASSIEKGSDSMSEAHTRRSEASSQS